MTSNSAFVFDESLRIDDVVVANNSSCNDGRKLSDEVPITDECRISNNSARIDKLNELRTISLKKIEKLCSPILFDNLAQAIDAAAKTIS